MAFWENLKSKYEDYDKWRKEKVVKPIEKKFEGTPLGSFGELKGYLGGVAERIKTGLEGFRKEHLRTPKQMQAERHAESLKGIRERMQAREGGVSVSKEGKPALKSPSPGITPSPGSLIDSPIISSLKNMLTPTSSESGETAQEKWARDREEWSKKWGDITTDWAKKRKEEIASSWMKESPTPSLDSLKEVPGKIKGGFEQVQDWYGKQAQGFDKSLSSAAQHLPTGLLESMKGLFGDKGEGGMPPGYKPEGVDTGIFHGPYEPGKGKMPYGYRPEGVDTGVFHGPHRPEEGELVSGLKELGGAGAIDTGKMFIGITDESKKLTIQENIDKINRQIDTLRWMLDMKPGTTLEQKTAYEQMAKGWAEAGASAEDIAKMIDNLTRADADKISNQIIPTYDKYLKTPEVTKAKDMLEGLYTKYSDKEKDLNDKIAEANQAMNAIKQSPYLTQSMIVGRTDRMRDEYNMEINSIRNDLNTLGADIDRGRGSLKTLMDEGFKMAGVEIGALGMGIEEDIMGRMPFGWESVASYMKGLPGEAPSTIGPGRFGWTGEGYEQVTPFAPQTPTATNEKQVVTEEHKYYLEGLAGTDGFVSLEDFMSMMEDWMYRTGSYNPQQYVSMFARRFLSPDERRNLPMELLGMGG